MKAGIHPEYVETTITCACGEVIHTRSTKQNIRVEICSKCHPFFSGKQKFIDTAGRIEKFEKKFKDQVIAPVSKTKQAAKRVIEMPKTFKMPKSQPVLSLEERRAAEKAAERKAKGTPALAAQAAESAAEKPAKPKAEKTPAST